MSFHKLLLSFNAGELSPLLDARSDLQKYASACQRLENFLILPYGGALRRPGTEYLGNAKFPNRAARLIPFNFSTTTNFQLEFGHEYIRFWSNGVQVQKSSAPDWLTATAYVEGNYVTESSIIYFCVVPHTSGTFATDLAAGNWVQQSILEVPTPYQESQLRAIHYCQINDVMYLVHPNHYPAKLSRIADDDWTWAKLVWKFPPTIDENVTNITVDPSATTGNITLTASSAIFSEGLIGSWWSIGHARTGAGLSFSEVILGATTANSAQINVLGNWEFTTYGSWQGIVRIERLAAGTTIWEPIRTYHNFVVGERNISATGTEEQPCLMRLGFTTEGAAGTNPLARLEVGQSRHYGAVEITGFTSTTVVSATVRVALFSATPTRIWAEGAFSQTQGFPRTVELHEGRLILAGTAQKPLGIHGSFIDDFENFRLGSRSDDAFFFVLSAKESNPIQWMVSQQGSLLNGTSGEEWVVTATDDQEALGPGNVDARRQSRYGSAPLQAQLINEVIMFVQRQGRKVRELTFAFEKDAWVSPDLNILANQISAHPIPPVPGVTRGIVEIAFQQQPDALVWTTTADESCAAMTYERDQNVVGWHRHSTDGVFESVSAIYGGSDADEVWFIAKRVINGQTVRYVERLKPDHRDSWDSGDKATWWYLDCAKRRVMGTASATVFGLSHLEGKTVEVLADGATQPSRVVSGGSITLQTAAKNVLVGLPFISTLKPMKLDAPMQDGAAQYRKARIHRFQINVHKSLGAQFSNDDETWQDIYFRKQGDPMDASPPVYTGPTEEISTGAGYTNKGCEISVRQDKPMPLCILSLTAILDFHGE